MFIQINDPVCGKVAFSISSLVTGLDKPSASDFILPDGTSPKEGDVMTCGSCGREVTGIHELPRPHELDVAQVTGCPLELRR